MAGKKILVADDSLTIQKVIRLALSGDGYEIQTVSDGKEAIEQASLFRPDICIIDVSLPHYDAYQIRENFLTKPDLRNIPVILMSSAFEKVDELRAEKLGFAGHLIKPFDPSNLRSTLLSVANQVPERDPIEAAVHEAEVLPLKFDEPMPSSYQTSKLDDVQEMAKSTFQMSGHDQQEWGMIEPGKNPFQDDFPPLASDHAYPHPSANEVTSLDFNEIPNQPGFSPSAQNAHGQISVTTEELEALVKNEVAKLLEQMNAQVHERVESELKQYARELMPSLAERIIKEEIHKLLTNPPL